MENTKVNDLKEKALNFAQKVRAGFLATIDREHSDLQPRVRGILMWYADKTGFYFHTAKSKSLYTQLRHYPRAEVAFFLREPSLIMLRIWGEVEFIEDISVKQRLVKDRPWLLEYGNNLDHLCIFRIARAKGKFWTEETNLKEHSERIISF